MAKALAQITQYGRIETPEWLDLTRKAEFEPSRKSLSNDCTTLPIPIECRP